MKIAGGSALHLVTSPCWLSEVVHSFATFGGSCDSLICRIMLVLDPNPFSLPLPKVKGAGISVNANYMCDQLVSSQERKGEFLS